MTDSKTLREELADAVRDLKDNEVAEAVRELRAEVEKLRAERAAHTCHGSCCSHVHCNHGHCGCFTVHYGYSYTNVAAGGALPLTYTVTSGTNISIAPWATTNVAAGCNPAVTVLSLTN